MYLAALNVFWKEIWQKAFKHRRKALEREYIDPQQYLEPAELLQDLLVLGMSSLHLGVSILPENRQAYVSTEGAIKGSLKKAPNAAVQHEVKQEAKQENSSQEVSTTTSAYSTASQSKNSQGVDLFIWGRNERNQVYDLLSDQTYLLALAAHLKQDQELASKSWWQLLTQEQQKRSPVQPEQVVTLVPHELNPDFAARISQIKPEDYAKEIANAYAFVASRIWQIYNYCHEIRHNNWNQLYLEVDKFADFEVDFAEYSAEQLVQGERLWEDDYKEHCTLSSKIKQDLSHD
ncbi:hypothetical protein [Psittacicella hinzii]|uniref:Uncharacterized protein n=1 Tax=Psittacicella hinzii TaxID=2028575 RepID=A0A3A1YTF1_9GAMM|nr:hypothetical protein [Psittacicella hinzii]RIY39317.1 hypothetical protein CKF58_02440 [Psittacicella hinzii]